MEVLEVECVVVDLINRVGGKHPLADLELDHEYDAMDDHDSVDAFSKSWNRELEIDGPVSAKGFECFLEDRNLTRPRVSLSSLDGESTVFNESTEDRGCVTIEELTDRSGIRCPIHSCFSDRTDKD